MCLLTRNFLILKIVAISLKKKKRHIIVPLDIWVKKKKKLIEGNKGTNNAYF